MQAIIAIVGAGNIGATLAHTLAGRDRVGDIRLIDEAAAGVASGKALDIRQAGPIEGVRAKVDAAGDLTAIAGSTVIAIADPVAGSEWDGDTGFQTMRRIVTMAGQASIVCAGAPQARLIERAIVELGFPKHRILGSAPAALAAAVRARLALEIGGAAADVSLSVIGLPPDRAFVPWSAAAAGGVPILDAIDPRRLSELERLLSRRWPPGPYALASAAARAVEALAYGSRRAFNGFVWFDDGDGKRAGVSAMLTRVGPGAIDRVLVPTLSVQERVRFDTALAGR